MNNLDPEAAERPDDLVLGLGGRTGALVPGAAADVVTWDAEHEGAFALQVGGVRPSRSGLEGTAMTETFMGADPPTATSEAVIIGAALATVYAEREPHATAAPDAIRAASVRLARFAGNYDFDTDRAFASWQGRIADGGDVNTARADAEGNRRRIATAVGDTLTAGAMPVLLGGDDSVAIPFLAGYRDHGLVSVVHIDAHLDFRDDVSGERFGYSSPMRRASEMSWIRRVIHVGQRGVGSARPADVQDSLSAGNTIVRARELARVGPDEVATRLVPEERFVIVCDVDGTNPADIPAVRAPVAGGPGIEVLVDLVGALAARGSLEGIVVTEFESEFDEAGRCALSLARLVCRALEARLG